MYKVVGSRITYLIRGFIRVCPVISLFWFFSMAANIGAPPTINLFREIILAGSIIKISMFFIPALRFSLFFSAAYSLFLYARSQNGGVRNILSGHFTFLVSDFIAMFLHLFPVYLMLVCRGLVFYGVS